MPKLEPNQHYPACLLGAGETVEQYLLPKNKPRRQAIHKLATKILREMLKDGDKVYAVRAESDAAMLGIALPGGTVGGLSLQAASTQSSRLAFAVLTMKPLKLKTTFS